MSRSVDTPSSDRERGGARRSREHEAAREDPRSPEAREGMLSAELHRDGREAAPAADRLAERHSGDAGRDLREDAPVSAARSRESAAGGQDQDGRGAWESGDVTTPPPEPPPLTAPPEPHGMGGAESAVVVTSDATGAGLLGDEQSRRFRSRWDDIQASFVDEPRRAVGDADALVREATDSLHECFERDRRQLEGIWDRGEEVTTEDLRVTLRRYRSFFERLLAV